MFKLKVFLLLIIAAFLWQGCSKHYDPFHSKSKWLKDFFDEIISGKYPDIAAINYWDENFGDTYLKINSSKISEKTYRNLVSDDIFITKCTFSGKKLIPVEGKMYLSAFPDFAGTEDTVTAERIEKFEETAGKEIAWAYFSNNWMDSLVFPGNAVQVIAGEGKTPFVRLMFRSVFEEDKEDPKYKLTDIINGTYDAALEAWAVEAANCGVNLLAEFGTEVNGSWFPWNGIYCGGGETTGYGDPEYPDGPEIFRDAYRHIIDICNQQGADNITWFFHFDDSNEPDEWWNTPEYYYPGDDYIDWIGVSVYGPFHRGDEYIKPEELIDAAYEMMRNVSENKPYAILEFGVTEL